MCSAPVFGSFIYVILYSYHTMFMSYVVFLICCAYMYHAGASWLRVSHVRQLLTVANFVVPRGVRSSRTPSSQTARLRSGHARSSPIGISSANSVPLGNASLDRRIRDNQTAKKARPSSGSQLAEAEADSQNETTQGLRMQLLACSAKW